MTRSASTARADTSCPGWRRCTGTFRGVGLQGVLDAGQVTIDHLDNYVDGRWLPEEESQRRLAAVAW